MTTEMEQIRTLSLLTNRPHLFYENGTHVAFLGYIFTYSSFFCVFMWALSGQNIYSKIWAEQPNSISNIKNLNTHDQTLQKKPNNAVGPYIADQLRKEMYKLEPIEIEIIVGEMLSNCL